MIQCRAPGFRLKLELYRKEAPGWKLVTGTKEVEGLQGFGLRHDVRGVDPATTFEVRGTFTSDGGGEPIRRIERGHTLGVSRLSGRP